MPKELKNTTSSIMNKIHKGGYRMRPRSYFVFISALAVTGLVISTLASVFSVSLTRFALRGYGSLAKPQAEVFALGFPWWILAIAIIGLLLGFLLIRRYDFSYKYKTWLVLTVLAVSTFAIGWGADAAKLSEVVINNTPVQKTMKSYQYRYENEIKEREQKRQIQQNQGQDQKGNQELNQAQPQIKNQFQPQDQGQPQIQSQGQTQNQNQIEIQETSGNNNIQENGQELKKTNNQK